MFDLACTDGELVYIPNLEPLLILRMGVIRDYSYSTQRYPRDPALPSDEDAAWVTPVIPFQKVASDPVMHLTNGAILPQSRR